MTHVSKRLDYVLVNHSRFNGQHNWGLVCVREDLYDHLRRIFCGCWLNLRLKSLRLKLSATRSYKSYKSLVLSTFSLALQLL